MAGKSKQGVSFAPSLMGNSIESLLASGQKPPSYSNVEMRELDFCAPGIFSIAEALRDRPISSLSQRDLSRYATRVARERMESSTILCDLRKSYRCYLDIKKRSPLDIRRQYDDILWGLAGGYKPFMPRDNIHLWFWENSDKNAMFDICLEAGVQRRTLHIFVADALSEIGGLEQINDTLKIEYKFGLDFLKLFLVCVNQVVLNISQAQS